MALTTQFKKCFLTIESPDDIELIFVLIRRYNLGGNMDVEQSGANTILFNKSPDYYTINGIKPASSLELGSSQIKKLVVWLESEYIPKKQVTSGDTKVFVDDDGVIHLNKNKFTKTDLENILSEINKADEANKVGDVDKVV